MEAKNKLSGILNRFKYPLLVLVVGILLMLMPAGGGVKKEDNDLQSVLSHAHGVGETYVIASDNGVVVVCSGADNAQVRLDVINAVSDYTGFGSDKITVLKCND